MNFCTFFAWIRKDIVFYRLYLYDFMPEWVITILTVILIDKQLFCPGFSYTISLFDPDILFNDFYNIIICNMTWSRFNM